METKHVMPESRRFPESVPHQLLAELSAADSGDGMKNQFLVSLVSWFTLFLIPKRSEASIFLKDFWDSSFSEDGLKPNKNMSEKTPIHLVARYCPDWLLFLFKSIFRKSASKMGIQSASVNGSNVLIH